VNNMKKILILIVVFGSCLLTGCGKTISELDKIVNENNYIIVDVRTEDEYNTGHVKNAINIPVDKMNDNIDLDKSKTIIVYCRSGKRSASAYNILISNGYKAYDLGAYESITKFEKGA